MNYVGPGKYKHYKGGYYDVLGLGMVEATKKNDDPEVVVIYQPLSPGGMLESLPNINFWTRPLDDFNDIIAEADPGVGAPVVPRFVKVDDYEF